MSLDYFELFLLGGKSFLLEFNEFGDAVEFLFMFCVGVCKGGGLEEVEFVVHVLVHVISENSHHAVDKMPDFLSRE